MSGFSRLVLEHAVRLAGEAIPAERDARISECIQDIRRYLYWIRDEDLPSDYRIGLREAVAELSGIALRHRELSLAGRLQDIVEQLESRRFRTIDKSRTERTKTAVLRLLLG
jgi:hypothetical protein